LLSNGFEFQHHFSWDAAYKKIVNARREHYLLVRCRSRQTHVVNKPVESANAENIGCWQTMTPNQLCPRQIVSR